MKVFAVILAAGRGERFGQDKLQVVMHGKPVWKHSFDAFKKHPEIDAVGIVCSGANLSSISLLADGAEFIILGGNERVESVRNAIDKIPSEYDIVLIHDGARPFISQELISKIVSEIHESGGAAPAIPVIDTLRDISGDSPRLVDRSPLRAMQTPQGAKREFFVRALQGERSQVTDDISLLEAIGVPYTLIMGEVHNRKITTPEDLEYAKVVFGMPETRTGLGYDIHPFSTDPSKPCWLGGVLIENHVGLEGHSDADVLLHAATDALLGGIAEGDIGQHFKNTDPRWKGADSKVFLAYARDLLNNKGWKVLHLDIAVIAETPKIGPHVLKMREVISSLLNIELSRVSVKATTNEKLGSLGRGEGIAAYAVATLSQI